MLRQILFPTFRHNPSKKVFRERTQKKKTKKKKKRAVRSILAPSDCKHNLDNNRKKKKQKKQ
jgi:hypothetical protein